MIVSAYAAGLRLTLATVAAKDRNEVDAALQVIGLIDLKGRIVTGDALHCNRRMVEAIVAKGARLLHRAQGQPGVAVVGRARLPLGGGQAEVRQEATYHSQDRDEGARRRVETRIAVVVEAKGLAEHHEFPGLKAFGRIEATREIEAKATTDVRIFALSRKLSPQTLLETARAHWQIENALHWQLDVSFGEDAARNRKDNGPANIAVLRRRA